MWYKALARNSTARKPASMQVTGTAASNISQTNNDKPYEHSCTKNLNIARHFFRAKTSRDNFHTNFNENSVRENLREKNDEN